LVPNGLPNELKTGNVTIKGDVAKGELAFNVTNAKAKPGVYTFYLRADTKYKRSRNPAAIATAEDAAQRANQELEKANAALQAAREQEQAANQTAQSIAQQAKAATDARQKAAADVEEATKAVLSANEALAALQERTDQETRNSEVQEAEQTIAAAAARQADAQKLLSAAKSEVSRLQQAALDAEQQKDAAKAAVTEATKRSQAVDAQKKSLDQALTEIKKFNAPKDMSFVVISTPIRVRIVDSPLTWTHIPDEIQMAQEGQAELPVALARHYGFDGEVQLTLEFPEGVSGLTSSGMKLAPGENQTTVRIAANKQAPSGRHPLTLRARAKFNNVDVQTTKSIELQIEQPKAGE
jgi:hypothetical protein